MLRENIKTYEDLEIYCNELEVDFRDLKNEYRALHRDFLNERNKSCGLENRLSKLDEDAVKKMKDNYESEIKNLKNRLAELEKNTLRPKQRQISDEQVKEIKNLLSEGLGYRKIADLTKWLKPLRSQMTVKYLNLRKSHLIR